MITLMNNRKSVVDYFKSRFQILQFIVDVVFLIWSTDEKNGLLLDHRSICFFPLASLYLLIFLLIVSRCGCFC